jgi:hypothetical protein
MGMDRFRATLRSRRRALAPLLLASVQLKAGQGLIEMVNQPHYGTNSGTEPAEIVLVYAGVKDQPITVLEQAAGRSR